MENMNDMKSINGMDLMHIIDITINGIWYVRKNRYENKISIFF